MKKMNHYLHKSRFFLLILFLAIVFLTIGIFTQTKVDVQEEAAINSPVDYVGGIQINEPNQGLWAGKLEEVGYNLCQVTCYAKQGIWNSDHLWWHYEDTTNVINEIRALKAKKINVIMVLRVALQHSFKENHFKWHGMIFPETKPHKEEWFYRYNAFVEMWSKICEREEVDILAIGSELNALASTLPVDQTLPPLLEYYSNEGKQLNHEMKVLKFKEQLSKTEIWEYGEKLDSNYREHIYERIASNISWSKQVAHTEKLDQYAAINQDRSYLNNTWHNIIRNARKHYNGKLTFAANFDNYNEVGFWDELDFMGINAYFPLRKISREPLGEEELYAELIDGWEDTFQQIETFKETQSIKDKPIFFTEIGYTDKENCTTAPWKGYGYSLVSKGNFDTLLVWQNTQKRPIERISAINALYEVICKDSIPLSGLSYWKLTTFEDQLSMEPFALLIDGTSQDELQTSLSQFLRKEKKPVWWN